MKLTTFTYTDAKGKQSNRTVLVQSNPSDKLSGIDVSELDEDNQAEFAVAMTQAHEAYIEMLGKIQAEFDVKTKFRQFFPEKMTDVQTLEF